MSQISFNVTESIATAYLSASRWKFTNPVLTDNQVMAKGLKIYVKSLIDEYNRFLSYGSLQTQYDEFNVSSSILQNLESSMRLNSENKKRQLNTAINDYNIVDVPLDIPD